MKGTTRNEMNVPNNPGMHRLALLLLPSRVCSSPLARQPSLPFPHLLQPSFLINEERESVPDTKVLLEEAFFLGSKTIKKCGAFFPGFAFAVAPSYKILMQPDMLNYSIAPFVSSPSQQQATESRICISTNLRKSKVTRTSKYRALQCQFQRLSLVTRVRHLPCLVRKHTLMYYACMGGGDSVLDYLMVGSNLGIYMYSVIHPLCCNYLLLLSPKMATVCLGSR